MLFPDFLKMSIVIKRTTLTPVVLKSGKKVIIEEDINEYCFPQGIWENIKEYLLYEKNAYKNLIIRIASFGVLDITRWDMSGNMVKALDRGLKQKTFEDLCRTKHWKNDCHHILRKRFLAICDEKHDCCYDELGHDEPELFDFIQAHIKYSKFIELYHATK